MNVCPRCGDRAIAYGYTTCRDCADAAHIDGQTSIDDHLEVTS